MRGSNLRTALVTTAWALALASPQLAMELPPAVTKSFSPNTIPFGGSSTMTITIQNPNTLSLVVPTGLGDTFPSGVVPIASSALASGCGAMPVVTVTSLATGVLTIPPSTTCTITVSVIGLTAGTKTNTVTVGSGLVGVVSVAGGSASDTLTVGPGLPPITKSFSPSTIPFGGASTMTITVRNPYPLTMVVPTGLGDTFPSGVAPIASSALASGCSATPVVTATSLATGVLTIPPSTDCIVTVSVIGLTAGAKLNTVNVGSGLLTGITGLNLPGGSASDTLTVGPGLPLITKSFSPSTISVGDTSTMTITVRNPYPLTMVVPLGLGDTFPIGMAPIISSALASGCGATPVVTFINLVVGILTIPPSTDCIITVSVIGLTTGAKLNTADVGGGLLTGITGLNLPSGGAQATLTVEPLRPAAISKKFTPDMINVGNTTVLTIMITNPNTFVMTGVSFTDAMPTAHLIITPAGDIQSVGCGVNAVGVAGSNNISLTNGTIAGNGTCTITVTVQGIAPGVGGVPVVNTTSAVTGTVQTVGLTGNVAMATLQIGASEISFLVRYASNLAIGDSVVNMTNIGNFSSLTGLPGGAQNGNICANVYAYSPDEQLVSCCTCVVTPNALNSLSVVNDLAGNTLTPIRPSSMVIKLVASAPSASGTCNAATVTRAGSANFLAPGLEAWGSTLHALPATAGSAAGTYGTTETPFLKAKFSDAELTRMTQLCAFIQANGSGYGICKSCKVGGLGASTK